MKKILFVTYGGGHVNIVRHLYKELSKLDYIVTIIALTNSVSILDREGIPYRKISEYLSLFKEKEKILEYGNYLAKSHYDQNSGLSYEDIAAYLGFSIYDLMKTEGNLESALEKFQLVGHKIFNPIQTMKTILAYENPDVLVLTSSMRMEKGAGLAANSLKVPVIRILDTIGDDDLIPYNCKICVMNKIAKENLLANNDINKNDIVITGQPDYEKSIEIKGKELAIIKEKLEIEKYDKVITYISQPKQEDRDIILSKLSEMALGNPSFLIIIKLHPNEFIEEFEAFQKLNIANMIIIKEFELPYIIELSNVLLTKFSMGGLYSVFMDKPLVVINILDEVLYPDYSKYGVATKVKDIGELIEKINCLLNQNSELSISLKNGRGKMLNKNSATMNVVKVIQEVIGK